MKLSSGNALAACLMAFTLLSGAVEAAPLVKAKIEQNLHARNNTGAGKRIVLWEWTLTQDVASYPGIQSSADELYNSAEVTAIMNWETWRPTELPTTLMYQPMARTPDQLVGTEWEQLTGSITNNPDLGIPNVVHFYNEPERNGVLASDAATSWRDMMLPLKDTYGVELVGPACASDDAGTAWCSEFMSYLSTDEYPNYIGVHFYTSDFDTSDIEISAAQAFIQQKYEEFYIPVVVSEIASTNRDATQVSWFTQDMTGWMDATEWVRWYGFFGVSREVTDDFVSPEAQQMDADGYWTDLGRYLTGLEY